MRNIIFKVDIMLFVLDVRVNRIVQGVLCDDLGHCGLYASELDSYDEYVHSPDY